MKKITLLLISLVIGFTAFAQTYSTLPAGAKPYGNQLYIMNTTGLVIGGNVGYGFRVLGTKKYVDSLQRATKPEALTEFRYPTDATFRPFSIAYINKQWIPSKSNKQLIFTKLEQMKPYFVDYINGFDTNNGHTMATAFKTIAYAYTQGARKIILAEGLYKNDAFGTITNTVGDDVFIIGSGNGKTIISAVITNTPTYTITTSNTYHATQVNIANIIDYAKVDSLGYPLKLKRVTSQALCEAEAGTTYLTPTDIYVHLSDNRVPDANVLPMADTYKMEYGSNAGYLYMEGVTLLGGASPFYVHGQTTTSTSTLTALFNNVNFLYGRGSFNGEGEGIKSDNVSLTWLENCIAYGNRRDGFNYKSSNNPTPQKVVEVNSSSFWNQNELNSSDINGSSAHNGAKTIRIGGNYHHNMGPNIVDVDQSVTVNIGTKAWASLGFSSLPVLETRGDYAVGNQSTLTDSAKMYLVGVQSGDLTKSYSTASGGGGIMIVDSTSVRRAAFSGIVRFKTYNTSSSAIYSYPSLSTYTNGYGLQGQLRVNRNTHQIVLADGAGIDRGQLNAVVGSAGGMTGLIQLKASDAAGNYQSGFTVDGNTLNSAFEASDIISGAKLSFPVSNSALVPFRMKPGGSLKTVIVEGGVEFVNERINFGRTASVREQLAYLSDIGTTSATSPIFYNPTTKVISSQAASGTLEGYVNTIAQTFNGAKKFNNVLTAPSFTSDGSQLFSYILKGGVSDNYGAFGFYSNSGATRYGYFQSHSTNGGQLVLNGDGGGNIVLDNRGVVINSLVASGITYPTINGISGQVLTTNGAGIASWSNSAVNSVPVQLKDFYTDATNTGLTESDLYSYSILNDRLFFNGDKITATFTGLFSDATASSQLRVKFAGITIGDTGALTMSVTGSFVINVLIIRTGEGTARATVNVSTPGASTASYTSYTVLPSVIFTNPNILKITGQAGGVGGSSGDITATMGNIVFQHAAL